MYLISSRFSNDNARQDREIQLWTRKRAKSSVFDIHEALILKFWWTSEDRKKRQRLRFGKNTKRILSILGESALSYSTFCHYTICTTHAWRLKRADGWNAFKSAILTYIPSEKLRYAQFAFGVRMVSGTFGLFFYGSTGHAPRLCSVRNPCNGRSYGQNRWLASGTGRTDKEIRKWYTGYVDGLRSVW